jgi:GTP-binding protein
MTDSPIRFPPQSFLNALSERELPLRMDYVSSGMKETDLPPSSGPEIAIVGRSNVGKSSLLNFVAGQKQLARVSSTPGRTQTINLFTVEKGAFFIVDLPGYGFAMSPKETRAQWEGSMDTFFKSRKGLVGVLFLLDIRRDVTPEDTAICKWLQNIGLPVLAVQTKCDKVHKSQWSLLRKKQSTELGVTPGMVVTTSTQSRLGLKDLCTGLAGMLIGARP